MILRAFLMYLKMMLPVVNADNEMVLTVFFCNIFFNMTYFSLGGYFEESVGFCINIIFYV